MKLFLAGIILLLLLSISSFGQSDSTFDEGRKFMCVFETQPSFPGGRRAIDRFIKENLVHPTEEYADGTVYLSVMINEDGSLSDFKILKGVCDQCDKNVIEAFKKMPNWIPAKQEDTPVKVRMIFPLRFTHS